LVEALPGGAGNEWLGSVDLPAQVPPPTFGTSTFSVTFTVQNQFNEYLITSSTAPAAPIAAFVIGQFDPIAISHLTVLPCTPSGLDLDGMARTLELFGTVRSRWPEKRCVIVPNRVDSRTLEGRNSWRSWRASERS
jgi:hypothetical protein